jgi:hypothetical protein
MNEVRSVIGVDYETCSVNRWYGFSDVRTGLKYRAQKFVGGTEPPVWWSVYHALSGAFRPCLHCLERSLLEADIEAGVANVLKVYSIPSQRQVATSAGIADIVTDEAVYEVKFSLTRAALFQAVGQVTCYAAALDSNRRRVIVGQETPEFWTLYPHIKAAGIEIKLW